MKTSQDSFFWSEMAEFTHERQVSIFGWCACEEGEKVFQDCPKNY